MRERELKSELSNILFFLIFQDNDSSAVVQDSGESLEELMKKMQSIWTKPCFVIDSILHHSLVVQDLINLQVNRLVIAYDCNSCYVHQCVSQGCTERSDLDDKLLVHYFSYLSGLFCSEEDQVGFIWRSMNFHLSNCECNMYIGKTSNYEILYLHVYLELKI